MKLKKTHTTKRLSNTKKMTFVLSTPDVDRVGDRVFPSWKLKDFLLNPIALAFHNHDKPVGMWENLHIDSAKNLVGDLVLAEKGTSPFIDSIIKLVEQGILKAVSIGFTSGKSKLNTFGGRDLEDNNLFECSLVSVPANQNAIRKELSYLPTDELDKFCPVNGCESISSESSPRESESKTYKNYIKGKTMTIAERIKQARGQIAEAQTKLKQFDNVENLDADQVDEMAQLDAQIKSLSGNLEKFEQMEKNAVANIDTKKLPTATQKPEAQKDVAVKAFVALAKAHVDGIAPSDAVAKFYGNDESVRIMTKATTASTPATTTDKPWAGELVQEGFASFLDTLFPVTVFGRVGGMRFNFDGYRSIKVPMRDQTGDVSGEFIAEGAPIPVKQDKFASANLTPKKLGVITVFTREILKSSTPQVESIVRRDIIQDTAKAIDKAFLDDQAETALRPAGLQNTTGTGASNIVASKGSDIASVQADIDDAMDRMNGVELGTKGVIIMNPARARSLNNKTNALGQYPFREKIIDGFDKVISTTVPADVVIIIDDSAMAFGTDIAPEFSVSNQATLVMSDPAEQIGDGSKVTAQPVRSLFQTDTVGLRFIEGMDWKVLRKGGVQVLTGVAW